jgi:hypothetical protein
MERCHKCKSPWESGKNQPAVKETCPQCNAYLHCCLNCRFHRPSAHNQCHIPTADWVGDRAGPNFCDEFEFSSALKGDKDAAQRDAARTTLDALFQEASPKKEPTNFDDLFTTE